MTKSEQKRFDKQYQKHLLELKLQGKSSKTIDAYARAIRRIVTYFDRCPDQVTPDELKLYLADLVDSRSWSTVKVDRNGLMFFWEYVLNKKWDWVKIVKPPQVRSLPDILTPQEVQRVIGSLEKLRYQTCLFTIYSLGLRLSEGITLKISDIDSARMKVHIRSSKGNKDRFIPLPDVTLKMLRHYWSTHRNSTLLFPRHMGGADTIKKSTLSIEKGTVQGAMKAAILDCGIQKKVTVNTLRHSYAVHLLEAGINLRFIQEYLGHSSPVTTTIYTQLANLSEKDPMEKIREVMGGYQFSPTLVKR